MGRKNFGSILFILIALTVAGCFGDKESDSKNDGDLVIDEGPFVEAYIEYIGPHWRWAGPPDLVVYVSAQGKKPVVKMVHSKQAKVIKTETRKPAAKMDVAIVRQEINELARRVDTAKENFHECLAPVRVRMVRGDGSVLQKLGCRDQTPWVREASRMFGRYMKYAERTK